MLLHSASGPKLKVYDTRTIININKIKPDFNRMRTSRESMRVKLQNNKFIKLPHDTTDPTINSISDETLHRIFEVFVFYARVPDNTNISLTYQRTTVAHQFGVVEEIMENKASKNAILVIENSNIFDVTTEFSVDSKAININMNASTMAVFDNISYYTYPLVLDDPGYNGHRDIIYISY